MVPLKELKLKGKLVIGSLRAIHTSVFFYYLIIVFFAITGALAQVPFLNNFTFFFMPLIDTVMRGAIEVGAN